LGKNIPKPTINDNDELLAGVGDQDLMENANQRHKPTAGNRLAGDQDVLDKMNQLGKELKELEELAESLPGHNDDQLLAADIIVDPKKANVLELIEGGSKFHSPLEIRGEDFMNFQHEFVN